MNGSRRRTSAILVGALGLAAADAQACGELMLRALGTMRYRAFLTKHPAEILLYSADPANSTRPAATDDRFHNALERVGHKVSTARGADGLDKSLAARSFDVIIAYADDMLGATSRIEKASRVPALIPVLDRTLNEREMRERYPRLVDGSFNALLKAIEQAMTPAGA